MEVYDTLVNKHIISCTKYKYSDLNQFQIQEMRSAFLAKLKWKKSDIVEYPLLSITFDDYQNQNSFRNFDYYCVHHLKNSAHIEEYKNWYNWAFPENTWFIDNLKYVSWNTFSDNEEVIRKYLRDNNLED